MTELQHSCWCLKRKVIRKFDCFSTRAICCEMYEMSGVPTSILKAKRTLLKRHKVHLRHLIDNVHVQFYDVHKISFLVTCLLLFKTLEIMPLIKKCD
jgi:hypothetical protein